MNELDDAAVIQFGKYKGQMLQDIDAGYFHYLWTHGKREASSGDSLANYIRKNIPAFKKENPDLIWD